MNDAAIALSASKGRVTSAFHPKQTLERRQHHHLDNLQATLIAFKPAPECIKIYRTTKP